MRDTGERDSEALTFVRNRSVQKTEILDERLADDPVDGPSESVPIFCAEVLPELGRFDIMTSRLHDPVPRRRGDSIQVATVLLCDEIKTGRLDADRLHPLAE